MSYIETYSGKQLDILLPDPDQICIEDIAHALAHVPRFAGHTKHFYSVAAHSINVARLVPKEHKLQALLHDATEAYLGDMPTPFKRVFGEFREAEDRLWKVISKKFGVNYVMAPVVKQADTAMLMTERDVLKPHNGNWGHYEDSIRIPYRELLGIGNHEPAGNVAALFKAQILGLMTERGDTV